MLGLSALHCAFTSDLEKFGGVFLPRSRALSLAVFRASGRLNAAGFG